MEDKVLFLKALEVLCEKIINLQNSLDVSEYFLEKAKKELEEVKKNMLVDSGENYE